MTHTYPNVTFNIEFTVEVFYVWRLRIGCSDLCKNKAKNYKSPYEEIVK